jgi:metacaspase-1
MRTPALLLCVLAGAVLLGAAPAQARQRALLIGVGDVPNNPLPAIDLDIDNMKKVAAVMGFTPGDIKVLFDEEATYANVRRALASWVREGVGPDDHVLIYFSGHGTRVPDPSSTNGVAHALVLHDVQLATIAGRASLKNVLMGREFGAALAAIPSRNVLVLLDACHSGTTTRELSLGNRRLGVGPAYIKFFSYPGMPAPQEHTRGLGAPSGSENYAALSAAREDEFAVGTEQGGLFTLGVVEAIDSASRDGGHLTVAGLQVATTVFIAAHTDEQTRHHPVADGNERLIRGALELIPLRNGEGPTWQALAALAAQGEPLTLSGPREVHLGEKVVLDVALPRAGYLNVVTVDSEDRAFVLYPNKAHPTNEVQAGRFQFPGAETNLVLRASEPLGPSLIVAFLTEKPVNAFELGTEGRDAADKMQQVFAEVSARATGAISMEARESRIAAGQLTVNVVRSSESKPGTESHWFTCHFDSNNQYICGKQ